MISIQLRAQGLLWRATLVDPGQGSLEVGPTSIERVKKAAHHFARMAGKPLSPQALDELETASEVEGAEAREAKLLPVAKRLELREVLELEAAHVFARQGLVARG